MSSSNVSSGTFPKLEKYRVGLILVPGFTLLDLMGPSEIFGGHPTIFETVSIGPKKGEILYSHNNTMQFLPHLSYEDAFDQKFDIVVLPGGDESYLKHLNDPLILEAIKKIFNNSQVGFTVCTGSFLLAKTGLLDGMKATSNKMLFSKYTNQFPKVDWIYKARWVHDQKFITASGVTAGIDAALYTLSLTQGKTKAEEFATILEYKADLDPENDPFAKVYND